MQKQLISFYDGLRLGIVNAFRQLLFKKYTDNFVPSKILIVRKGTIGDHVVCQPFYLAFKKLFKNAQIDLLTSIGGNAYGHIKNLPEQTLFTHTYNFEDYSLRALRKILAVQQYTLVIEFPQDLDTLYTQIRNMVFYKSCGIRYGLGWSIGNSYLFKNYRYFNLPQARQFEKHSATLLKQGFSHEIAEKYLDTDTVEANTFDLPAQYIVIAPGAKFSAKTWDVKNYQAVAKTLVERGCAVVILGSAREGEAWNDLAGVINLAGKTSIAVMKGIIKNALLFIGNDSGPMHLAYSLNTPVVALFGSRNYPKTWWPPERANVVVIHHASPKNPVAFINLEHTQKSIDTCKNLRAISVEEVLNHSVKLLNTKAQ